MSGDKGARNGDWGPSWQSDKLQQALIDVSTALEASEIDDDPAFRREVFLRLLDNRLTDDESVFGMPYLANLGTYGPPADGDALDEQIDDSANRAVEVARYLDIPPDRATELFDLNGPVPVLAVKASRLAKARTEAVRQITTLLTTARTALNLPTGANDIRAAAQHYGKFDGNFSQALESCDGIAVRGQAGSPNRRIQLLAPGVEDAKRIAQDLLD